MDCLLSYSPSHYQSHYSRRKGLLSYVIGSLQACANRPLFFSPVTQTATGERGVQRLQTCNPFCLLHSLPSPCLNKEEIGNCFSALAREERKYAAGWGFAVLL